MPKSSPINAFFQPENRSDWRQWLADNHDKSRGVWLIYFKKHTGRVALTYEEAVEEALCFGWIDSTQKVLDIERYQQLFTPRKPNSTWAKSNKERVARLIKQGRMTPAGMRAIEIARKNGAWTMLDAVEAMEIPDDLRQALLAHKPALQNFKSYSGSVKKMALYWLASAKRPETREKRIRHIVDSAQTGITPFPPSPPPK